MKTERRRKNTWHVWCHDKDGRLKWEDEFENLVTTEGMKHELDTEFGAGTQAATWYIGLVNNAGWTAYAIGDTAAQIGGTNGWAEATVYDETTRPEFVENEPTGTTTVSLDNSVNKAVFTISATVTIRGCFLVSTNTKAGTTGTLSAVGDFTGGSRALVDNDVLNVQVTCSLS